MMMLCMVFLFLLRINEDQLHFHLAPKYVDGPDYGGTFQMNPGKVYLTDVEYQELVEAVRSKL